MYMFIQEIGKEVINLNVQMTGGQIIKVLLCVEYEW